MSTRQSIPASPPRRKAPVAVQLARQARHEAWVAKREAQEREARIRAKLSGEDKMLRSIFGESYTAPARIGPTTK